MDRPNSLEVTGPFEKPEGPGLASYIYIYIYIPTDVRYNNAVYIHVYRWNNSTGIRGEKCILRADVGESMRNEEECAAFEIKKF